MLSYLIFVLLVASATAFILLFLQKTGIIEQVQIHASKLISKLFSCHFCLSFWTALVLALFLAMYFRDYTLLLIPVFSAPITRRLL